MLFESFLIDTQRILPRVDPDRKIPHLSASCDESEEFPGHAHLPDGERTFTMLPLRPESSILLHVT